MSTSYKEFKAAQRQDEFAKTLQEKGFSSDDVSALMNSDLIDFQNLNEGKLENWEFFVLSDFTEFAKLSYNRKDISSDFTGSYGNQTKIWWVLGEGNPGIDYKEEGSSGNVYTNVAEPDFDIGARQLILSYSKSWDDHNGSYEEPTYFNKVVLYVPPVGGGK